MREVLTYSRRGSRFTPKQQQAWDTWAERFWIPDERVDQPGFSFAGCFDSDQPLIVEIGSGIGEATAALAAQRPAYNILGFEVWRPGVAESVGRVGELGLTNVRMCSVDAVWCVEHLLARGAARRAAGRSSPTRGTRSATTSAGWSTRTSPGSPPRRLAPGAAWRLATDWADYADQAQEVLDAEPLLEGGRVPRWEDRPVTRFERRGVAEGREISDLAYRHVGQP